jgi:hypothetical protein
VRRIVPVHPSDWPEDVRILETGFGRPQALDVNSASGFNWGALGRSRTGAGLVVTLFDWTRPLHLRQGQAQAAENNCSVLPSMARRRERGDRLLEEPLADDQVEMRRVQVADYPGTPI